MSHNKQKKIAVINDISGFGRCSAAVSLPVISHMRVQACLLPTSIFSNHTGFPSYYYNDFTDKMPRFMEEWKKLDLCFEGIASGFLGSAEQIEIVREFIRQFRDERTQVIIDPVMGENGKAYPTYTAEMCDKMKHLVEYADILTPNVTEACMLTGMPFKDRNWQRKELLEMMARLRELGAKKIVVSGLDSGQFISNAVSEVPGECKLLRQKRVGKVRSGTGDIFSSIIAADCVNGVDFETSVRKAAAFVQECIRATEKFDIPETDGVCFEEVLHKLR
ncbi:MAG: pyridoxamine kinase [Eubacterium sp.]|nr:pyridoxamine kinase [Eubacterium sp.]